ncbi:golgin-84 [Microplitis demolitor]|uniref:golgin-84 n=1 Tax=Microplitis demolitor TaxID=69319 RepID=UPI0004CDCA8B|nr:golgin-84 [Microplitis demolitor]XP_053593297.1 golgin-84 [Microplitis demolitor]
MAWLSDLAGKAENLLNKIDKNTAAVLSKDKNDIILHDELTDITWGDNSPNGQSQITNTLKKFINKEDELQSCSNSPVNSPTKQLISNSILNAPSTPSSLSVEHSVDNKDFMSEYSAHSSRSSPEFPHTLVVDVPDVDYFPKSENYPPDIYTKFSPDLIEADDLQNGLTENNVIENKLETMKQFDDFTNENNKMTPEFIKKNYEEENKLLLQQNNNNKKEIEVLKEKLQLQETEVTQYVREISNLQSVLERNRLDLQSTREELERYRARALKTLQEKDKLIAELKYSNSPVIADSSDTELNQLNQECDSLRQENQQLCRQLKVAQEELINADLKIEEINKKIIATNRETYEIISSEKKKRVEAEEDTRMHLEETRALKHELSSQRESWSIKLQKQEIEISRLKSQLSAISTPSSAIESRLSALTQTLVSKQNELEALTSDRNALRLQLEKRDHEYRRLVGSSRKFNFTNDTDDAKSQVPTFLIESPFDTGVTRRVKRAYSTLDTISIRIGVFLRRYPLARIFVIIYITFLQFWVLVVLFFQSHSLM